MPLSPICRLNEHFFNFISYFYIHYLPSLCISWITSDSKSDSIFHKIISIFQEYKCWFHLWIFTYSLLSIYYFYTVFIFIWLTLHSGIFWIVCCKRFSQFIFNNSPFEASWELKLVDIVLYENVRMRSENFKRFCNT